MKYPYISDSEQAFSRVKSLAAICYIISAFLMRAWKWAVFRFYWAEESLQETQHSCSGGLRLCSSSDTSRSYLRRHYPELMCHMAFFVSIIMSQGPGEEMSTRPAASSGLGGERKFWERWSLLRRGRLTPRDRVTGEMSGCPHWLSLKTELKEGLQEELSETVVMWG